MAAELSETTAGGPPEHEPRRVARRALFRAAAYAAPALLGTFVMARRAEAMASCLPVCTCRPNCCFPDVNCFPWF